MEEFHMAPLLLSIITLLIIANFTYFISKKIKFPYTLLLVLVGIILIPISQIEYLSYIRTFELDEDVLFYIFLPVLLFEAAYNIHFRGLLKNIKAISLMAVVGLLVSTLIIGFGLYYLLPLFSFAIPLSVALLFGAIISATDPVAVVALFKEYGAPKKLGFLFEGESLFNDGTAVAMFVVILGVIAEHNGVFSGQVLTEGFIIFLSLIFFGIIFGLLSGYVFSKAMGIIKDENVQITFSLLSAHLTFILAEMITENIKVASFDIHISGIIATVISAVVIGNSGRYKLSPKAESYTNKFWHYFAFISNSFVFLLLGLLFYKVDIHSLQDLLIPITLGIVITAIARAVSIYTVLTPLNYFKWEKPIPKEWMMLLSWGSLRGSLAIIMVLMIPDGLTMTSWELGISIKDFIFVMVSTSIIFTLFVKGLTIAKMMKKLKLDSLEDLEQFEYFLGKAKTYSEVVGYLEKMYKAGRLTKDEYEEFIKDFYEKIGRQKSKISEQLEKHPEYLKDALKFFALGIERSVLKDLYQKNLISEKGYRKYKDNILIQKEILQEHEKKSPKVLRGIRDLGANITKKFYEPKMERKELYLYYRTLSIASSEAIKELQKIKNDEYIPENNDRVDKVLKEYKKYLKNSNRKKMDLVENHPDMAKFRKEVLYYEIYKREYDVVNNISENDFITNKLDLILKKEFKKKENFRQF